jgi:hypothetical protein
MLHRDLLPAVHHVVGQVRGIYAIASFFSHLHDQKYSRQKSADTH